MDPLMNLLLIVFSISTNILQSTAQGKKSVTIALHSNWKDTPLHLEASEFLAEESSDLFWSFVEDISSLGPGYIKNASPKAHYEAILNVASPLISPAKVAILKFSLALRTYSPAIQMFHQILYDKHQPECDAVVDVGGQFACDIPQLHALLQTAHQRPRADVYKVDHKYPSLISSNITAILYGEMGTANFQTLHNFLKNEAENQRIEYYLRHFVKDMPERKAQLSGYGVELNIKSTEYKAQDDTVLKEDQPQTPVKQFETEELEGFIFSHLKELYPTKQGQLEEFKSHLLESTKEIATLKVWELQDLSLQAAQRIVISPKEETLRVMRDIAQNFPTRARSLVDIKVDPNLQREISKNQHMFSQYHNIAPPDAALFLNGLYNDVETMEMFTLLQSLKQETRILEGLHAIGVPGDKLSTLLKLDFGSDRDDFAVDFRDSSIMYINDMENDKAYRHWPSSLRELLRPMFPGMLRNIRKNIFHLVIIADPSKDDVKDIFKLAESFYIHNAPVRIGFVFAVNPDPEVIGFSDPGVAFLEAFNFIAQDKNPYKGLSFITDVYATVSTGEELTANAVIRKFSSIYPNEDIDLIFGADSDYDTGRILARDFLKRTGLGQAPIVLLNGIPLKQKSFTPEVFEDAILAEIMKQTGSLQRSVYKGDLTDSDDVLDYLMSQPNVMPRLNQRILGSSSSYIDLSGKVGNISFSDFEHMALKDMGSTLSYSLKYLQKNMDEFFRPLSAWIVADLESSHGRQLFLDALNHIKSSTAMRIALIHNPENSLTFADNPIASAAQAALTNLDPSQAKLFLNKLLKPTNAELVIKGEKTALDFALSTMDLETFQRDLDHLDLDLLKIHWTFCKKALKLSPGARTIVLNGKVLGAMDPSEDFMEDDFHLLEKYSMNVFGNTLKREFKQVSNVNSDIIMKATALLLSNPQSKQRYEVRFAGDKYSVIDLPPTNPALPAHDIIAIVDPVSRSAQKLAPILSVLQKVVNTNIRIFLNSAEKHSSMPLKSFFRWVMDEEPQFPTVGEEEDESEAYYAPVAHFANLPTSPLLTLAMATPENWMVAAVQSIHDLDNIHLEKVERGVWATFELEHLILEGHCFEQNTGNPPRGLQFTLGTNSTPVQMDTIVMANLGYFQLKANPGAWTLRLRQGRSADIYDIVGHENTDSPSGSSEVVTVINNFRSITIRIKVTKKPSMQYEDLLQDTDDDDQGGIWNSLANTFGSTTPKDSEDPEDNRINIFSLASGHLYERLLRIMMLSVLKHTKTPVKFWFLKNYLSPTFKEFLPYMAQQYKFEYELVQYKWPRWLNQQTEKQRIIWGYKILFLDVLFPLNVKKIIFVDADQIVRTDLKELRDLDLHGAPYGYTPFCDSRTDMEGYRFWKTGYWASHMGKKKYHISALYVVDLRRFRRMAAGDRLRGQYQGLSQDPNSLSNLDQDLPNNMIHQVPIFSLPQDWLWCATWCDDESKPRAKTIDLCNNPKTKESKLKSAMRIIPEWKDYDEEIKQLIEKYEQEKAGIILPEAKDHLPVPHSEL